MTSALVVGLSPLGTPWSTDLEAAGVEVRTAENVTEAIRLAVSAAPDLILLGETLDADLAEVVSDLRQFAPSAWVLFLLGQPSIGRSSYLITLGIDDVLVAPHGAERILHRAALGRLLAARRTGAPELSPGSRRLWVDRFSRTVRTRGESICLTLREFELLERLCQTEGRVVSREALLEDIWGRSQDSEAVLDATVHRLRRKLEPDPTTPRLLVTVRGVGYRMDAAAVAIIDS